MLGSRSLLGFGALCGLTVAAAAQPEGSPPQTTATAATTSAKVHGRVVTSTGAAVPGAVVTVPNTSASAIADGDGNFELADVPAGTQTISVEATGYATKADPVQVVTGHDNSVVVHLADAEVPGEEIIVAGTRLPEKRLDAPVTVEVVTDKDLKTVAGTSYLAALSRVKGIDYSESGLGDQRISARGFATQFNSRMITMIDGRLAQMPGNGLPMGSLAPTAALDMKSVEVVVGPASALYGPNAHTGVINIVTKTPWDQSGATVSLKGGSQSMLAGGARIAGIVADNFGWKVNGEYLQAEDFKPDPATHSYGTTVYEGDVVHNYDAHSAKTDGTLYYKQGDWLASIGGGFSDTTGFSITNTGRNHLRNWQVNYETAQLISPHLYAQVTRTGTDAGKTYQLDQLVKKVAAMGLTDPADIDALRDKSLLIDKSSMLDSELQLRYDIAGVKTTLGGQARNYTPSSKGTYLDDADKAIDTTEVGSYIQLDTTLWEKLRLAGAARVDHHSIYGTQFSPKAAVQYEVAPSQNVRFGYNRAFKSPTVLEDYLKIANILLGNRTGFEIKDMAGNTIADIAPLKPEQVDALELGYKGAIGDSLYIDAVAYQSWYRNFISPLTSVANPMMGTFASYANGQPVAEGTPVQGMLSTYMNFGKAQVRGVDIGVDYRPIPQLTLSGSASAMQLVSFTNNNALEQNLLLNAPTFKLRGSVQADDLGLEHSFARVDARYHNRYDFASGYWNTETLLGGKLPSRVVLDITAGYKFVKQGITVSGTMANLLDDRSLDVLGAPIPRRFMWLQLTYDYDGLKL